MRNYRHLLEKRQALNRACRVNPDVRATALRQCSEDKVFWFDNFAFTYDPRVVPSNLPFILYPKQIRFTQWLDNNLVISRTGIKMNLAGDKPRDVGVTFTFMGWCLWYYMFDEFVARVGSRKEDYVDKRGETDTLFYKLDYIMERLPAWMLEATGTENWRKYRSYMMFGHPKKENAISGESANPNFGRGGRKSITAFDEFGFWQWAKSSWESSGESTNLRFAFSTPPETGRDSHHYKVLTGQKGEIERFEFDWKDVPGRDKQWLDRQRATKSDAEFQREVMKSFEGTVEGKVYAFDFRFAKLTECDYNPDLPLFTSWDIGLDETALLWIQKDFDTNRVYAVDSFNKSNKAVDYFIPFITGEVVAQKYSYSEKELDIILRHKDWKDTTHFAGPDVKNRNSQTGKSTREVLKDASEGKIWLNCLEAHQDHLPTREAVKMLFRRLEINEERCEYFIDAMRNARYPETTETSQPTTEVKKPIHDWTSHFRTALEYYVDNEPSRGDKGAVLTEDTIPDDVTPAVRIKDGMVSQEEMEWTPHRQKDWRYE